MHKILQMPIENEMKSSYIDYAMSVIISRALPDVRDGLKPVHRRILYAMDNLGLTPDKAFRKSATIVGDVIGKYHPHGDASVYEALVRMAQDFNLRYKLVEGQGNFGSIDGDPAAAYRYTEAKMSVAAVEMLEDLESETIDFRDNFDGSLQEPSVLPSKLPNLLINGSSGIAVGMATNIPPHNLAEVTDALITLIDDPDTDNEQLIEMIKGPDFPTGGLIMGTDGCRDAYRTGKGTIVMRAKIEIEEKKKKSLIVTEIPYQINKTKLIEQIAAAVKAGKINYIKDLRDESDREGMRIVIELAANAKEQIVLNQLYKHSNLQCSFGAIMLALVNGEPKLLTLKEMLYHYTQHRVEIVKRRSLFELRKSQERAHLLEGLIKAIDQIDEVIKIIRTSKDSSEASKRLMARFALSQIQAKAILEMQLQRLTGLQKLKLEEEYGTLIRRISELEDLLASERMIYNVIKKELRMLKKKYGDDRRTQIVEESAKEVNAQDLIAEEKVVVTLTEAGFIKRTPMPQGKSVGDLPEKKADETVCYTTTYHTLLMITNIGKMYRLKVHEVPELSKQSRGTAAINIVPLEHGERVITILAVKELKSDLIIMTISKKGYTKKTRLSEYESARKAGILVSKLDRDDELIKAEVLPENEDRELIFVSAMGTSSCFSTETIPMMGRTAKGVRPLKIIFCDKIVAIIETGGGGTDLVILSAQGNSARISIHQYKTSAKSKIQIMKVKNDDEIVAAILTVRKAIIRIQTNMQQQQDIDIMQIPTASRSRKGHRLLETQNGEIITSMEAIVQDNED